MQQYILPGLIKQFRYYKQLGDKTIRQLDPALLHWQYNAESNSIAILINHMAGNMLSRFTNFLTEDGEKEWRQRDAEFEDKQLTTQQLLHAWEEAWSCVFSTLENLREDDLERQVYIRNMGHTALEAIHRQLAHYAYHTGQIVFIGKMLKDQEWESLSIPKGQSETFNQQHFNQPKTRQHFTDEFLKED